MRENYTSCWLVCQRSFTLLEAGFVVVADTANFSKVETASEEEGCGCEC